MFVSKRRWILKTCGTTRTLACLEPLLEMAEQIAGYCDVDELFYSRKNFKRPEMQVSPHRGFQEEVELLDSFFDEGRAYCMGSVSFKKIVFSPLAQLFIVIILSSQVNRDCWYIYTFSRGGGGGGGGTVGGMHRCIENIASPPSTPALVHNNEPDQTIEILMTELDPQVMAIFTKEECGKSKEATEVFVFLYVFYGYGYLIGFIFVLQRSGIHKILPGMLIDDYLFDPCGYSMNGISKNNVSLLRARQRYNFVYNDDNLNFLLLLQFCPPSVRGRIRLWIYWSKFTCNDR